MRSESQHHSCSPSTETRQPIEAKLSIAYDTTIVNHAQRLSWPMLQGGELPGVILVRLVPIDSDLFRKPVIFMTAFSLPNQLSDLLATLVAIPSVNPMGRPLTGPEYLETRLSDWLTQYFEALGVEHERIPVAPGRDNVIARYVSDPAAPTLLLDAHQDTVPIDGMTIPPFEPRIEGGRLYGRGSADVKGGMAAMLFAFRRLVEERPSGAANVILSCTCDEEATILGISDLVTYWNRPDLPSRILQTAPDAAIVAEPTELDVVVAHRGVVRFRLHTAGRACHSSDPTQGVNAIYHMGHVLTCLESYAGSLSDEFPPHPLCGPATLSVGRIEGGQSVNIVPDACSIEVDRRVIPGEEISGVVPHLRDWLAEKLPIEFHIESPWLSSPALCDDNNGWLAESLLEHIQTVTGQQHRAVGVPYGTHASLIAEAGVPAVVFGPGSIAQAHTKDEFIELASLEQAAEVYYQLCLQPPAVPLIPAGNLTTESKSAHNNAQ